MDPVKPFQWRHFAAAMILRCVRWYLRYSLSYRAREELLAERGRHGDHTTLDRWVQRDAPECAQRARAPLKPTPDSWRVDETYIRVRGYWTYRYRAGTRMVTDSSSCSVPPGTRKRPHIASVKP